jgi:putative mRNA 3-end processing factor
MLITKTPKGLYCPQADVFIDPSQPVQKALITHAHSDHARSGSQQYLAHHQNKHILQLRLGKNIQFQGVEFNQPLHINGVKISFHPSGHIPGSAQIRLEYQGEIWVITGDYKLNNDELSTPFEHVKCHHFVTESTFGLPVFNWQPQDQIFNEINEYWKNCAENGENLIISAYSLGKSQRIIKHLNRDIGPILCHSTIVQTNLALEADGFSFGSWDAFNAETWNSDTQKISTNKSKEGDSIESNTNASILVKANRNKKPLGAAIICPPAGITDALLKKIQPYRSISCSGWMAMRGARNWGNLDRGFVLSDHADFNELITACKESTAENIYVTHGYTQVFAKYLNETLQVNTNTW